MQHRPRAQRTCCPRPICFWHQCNTTSTRYCARPTPIPAFPIADLILAHAPCGRPPHLPLPGILLLCNHMEAEEQTGSLGATAELYVERDLRDVLSPLRRGVTNELAAFTATRLQQRDRVRAAHAELPEEVQQLPCPPRAALEGVAVPRERAERDSWYFSSSWSGGGPAAGCRVRHADGVDGREREAGAAGPELRIVRFRKACRTAARRYVTTYRVADDCRLK
jgi:hypothetical protein